MIAAVRRAHSARRLAPGQLHFSFGEPKGDPTPWEIRQRAAEIRRENDRNPEHLKGSREGSYTLLLARMITSARESLQTWCRRWKQQFPRQYEYENLRSEAAVSLAWLDSPETGGLTFIGVCALLDQEPDELRRKILEPLDQEALGELDDWTAGMSANGVQRKT